MLPKPQEHPTTFGDAINVFADILHGVPSEKEADFVIESDLVMLQLLAKGMVSQIEEVIKE